MPALKRTFFKQEDDFKSSRGCEIVRAPTEALDEIRTLPSPAIILLLTPVTAPVQTRWDSCVDPFEALGRSISKKHARVRHVPYVAKIGLTGTHRAFMQQANAIVIASKGAPPSTSHLLSGDASDLADSVFEFVQTSAAPMAVIQFGGAAVKFDDDSNDIYLRASHACDETFALASCLLFGTET